MKDVLEDKNVLIVEDEYFIASDLKKVLSSRGAHIVGPVGDLVGGLRLAESGSVDVAILDVNLAGSNSYPLADNLAGRDTPYMFLTGYDGWSMPEEYRNIPRISKPFCETQVVQMIEGLLERRGA
jgi:DNA-binding NarL/FixJ family response regulator